MDGADKPFCVLGGETLLSHVIGRICPQAPSIVISANGDLSRYAGWGLAAIPDVVGTNFGPLAGLLAGMNWSKIHNPAAECVISLPADLPFVPSNYVQHLLDKRQDTGADVVMASSDGRIHFAAALWPLSIIDDLRRTLSSSGPYKVEAFANQFKTATANFEFTTVDPFHNVNSAEDLAVAEKLLLAARAVS